MRHCHMENLDPVLKAQIMNDMKLRTQFMDCAHILHYRREKRHGQKRVLHLLKEYGPMSQSALLEHFKIHKASLSELLIKLQDQGLIIREKMEDDRRNYQVSLSDKALQELTEKEETKPTFKALFEVLDDNEKAQLSAILTKLQTAWSENEEILPRHKKHHHKRNLEESDS